MFFTSSWKEAHAEPQRPSARRMILEASKGLGALELSVGKRKSGTRIETSSLLEY
jgi:hypothetical protein